jgi:hypothetical protein
MDMGIAENLVGQVVHSLKIVNGHLTLVLDQGIATLDAEGDCCAHAWVESFNNSATLPARITGWEHRERKAAHEGGYDNVVDYDFYLLKTESGYIDIELRTSHNGYYCGWLNWGGIKPLEVPLPVDLGNPNEL